ncbi:MAG: cysteine hydrolase [Clostridia bacterium]|nr:cysteine hydrolase [Clostridia bacterium]
MKRFLIVVDMQNDFVDGSLGTKEALAIIPAAAKKIEEFDGMAIATFDTHFENYSETAEGKNLPVPHCIEGTEGWELNASIKAALDKKAWIPIKKLTFGSVDLPHIIAAYAYGDDFEIELIGLCTDICVVSNALMLKAAFPEKRIAVDAACCAGVTPALHKAALDVMRSCQIDVIDG